MRRNGLHAALAGGNEDQFRAAADDADLDVDSPQGKAKCEDRPHAPLAPPA